MHYLVMWSGGIDSTYTLAHLLKNTDHKINAHHIHLMNAERRHLMEAKACLDLFIKMQEIREFVWTQTTVDYSKIPGHTYDMADVCYHAGAISKAFAQNSKTESFDKWTIGTHLAEGHWQERFDILMGGFKAASWSPEWTNEKLPEFELQPMFPKIEEMDFLDELGLLHLCWYCRTPRNGKRCKVCKTCVEVTNAILDQPFQQRGLR